MLLCGEIEHFCPQSHKVNVLILKQCATICNVLKRQWEKRLVLTSVFCWFLVRAKGEFEFEDQNLQTNSVFRKVRNNTYHERITLPFGILCLNLG